MKDMTVPLRREKTARAEIDTFGGTLGYFDKASLAAAMAVCPMTPATVRGNLESVLPEHAAGLKVVAHTGAGNVTIEMTGRGKVLVVVEAPLECVDRHTYTTSDYETASDKVDITIHSSAGNVSVEAT